VSTLITHSLGRALVVSAGSALALLTLYITLEPFFAAGASSQTVVVTLNVTSGVAVTVDSNALAMSTNLSLSQNTAVATSTFTVNTNDSLGYTFQLAASTNPAMQSGSNKIPDFPTTTPQLWTSGIGSVDSRFGFSVIGNNITGAAGYWGTGSYCNGASTSTISTTLKYFGFYTTATTTAKNSSTTTPSGNATIVCYAVNQNNVFIPGGTYTASITGTVIAN